MSRPCIYPWESWLASEKTTLTSDDYNCTQRSMCVLIRMRAAKLKKKYSVYPKKNGNIIIVPRPKAKFK